MKRITAIPLMILMLLFAFCGCGSNASVNTIQPWDAADEQAKAAIGILTLDGYSAFAGFDIDESFHSAKIGIEYYQDTKLVKDENQGSVTVQKTSQGLAGFGYRDGNAVLGISADGNIGGVSHVQLPGFEAKDGEEIVFAPINEAQDISDGQKIYLGVINSGSDTFDASVLTDPNDKSGFKGKTWLFYVAFSTEPLE